jgi:hypothetical protein
MSKVLLNGGGAGDPFRQRELFIDNLLVRIHFIIVMIRWTGLAPWEFEFFFSGRLSSTFLVFFPFRDVQAARVSLSCGFTMQNTCIVRRQNIN